MKAWEPPTADFLDLMKELRKCLSDAQPIQVFPVFEGAFDAATFKVWNDRLHQLGDPYLSVHQQLKGGSE